MGDLYRDSVTGFEGKATAIHHFITGCNQVTLENAEDGKLNAIAFDETRLEDVVAAEDRPGGPPRVIA